MPVLPKLRAKLRKLTSKVRRKAEHHVHVHVEEEETFLHPEGFCLCEFEREMRKRDSYVC